MIDGGSLGKPIPGTTVLGSGSPSAVEPLVPFVSAVGSLHMLCQVRPA